MNGPSAKNYDFFLKHYIRLSFHFSLQRTLGSLGSLFVDMKIFNPHFVTNQKAIVEWTDYCHSIGQRISNSAKGYSGDDFSATSTGKLIL